MAKRGSPKITISIIVFFAAMLAVLSLFWMYRSTTEKHLKNELKAQSLYAKSEIENVVKNNIDALNSLKHRLEFTNGEYFEYWPKDANDIIEKHRSIKFVEWIDSNMIIKGAYPVDSNAEVIGLDVSKVKYRVASWQQIKKDSSINITHWTELIQGGRAFLIDVPIFIDDRFYGTITGGFDFDTLFDEVFSAYPEFAIRVNDNRDSTFYAIHDSEIGEIDNDYIQTYKIKLPIKRDITWKLNYSPSSASYYESEQRDGYYGLVAGFLLSILLALLVWLFLSVREAEKKRAKTNEELERLNDYLKKTKKEVEQASEFKTVFLSNMSHEIRTPLNAIVGFTEILKKLNLGSEEKKYLSLMDLSARNLMSLVNDILDIDKIESGKASLREDIFEPCKELNDLTTLFEHGFSEKGLYIKLDNDCHENITVKGDRGKFNQIFTNLIGNALKFTDEGGVVIKARTEINEDELKIHAEVNDTGVGIPEDKLEDIFGRFIQVENENTKRHKGSGLGLYITREIVNLMGGQIKAKSKEGNGSSFIVDVKFEIVKQKSKADTETIHTFDNSSILVAEDNPINVAVIKNLLKHFNVTPKVVSNGKDAMEMIEDEYFDVVFMDLFMPELDGIDAVRKLRKGGYKGTIIGLSADAKKETIEQAYEAGVDSYIVKPISYEQLHEILSTYASSQTSALN
ncbi:response regulator [Salibacter halophilus]|uniref:histidine kinase n=1 Tax=Salibacter halophilus TaxID=1803916 RepID=A0A6N6M8G9_9FLAO|nr:response regulator [Salibacter halophilus]KAB1064394.1 response regulator [Salibacter halophilus]